MLVAYLDETGHSRDTDHVGMAGLIGGDDAWPAFDAAWAAALLRAGVRSLHMRQLAHFRGEYQAWSGDDRETRRRGLLSDALAAIRGVRPTVLGAVMPMRVWRGLTDRQRRALLDPYFVCLQECLTSTALLALRAGQRVRVVFSRNTEFAAKATLLWRVMRADPLFSPAVDESLVFGSADEVKPLQAADLVAYEALQAARGAARGVASARWPWLQLRKLPSTLTLIDEEVATQRCPAEEALRRAPGPE
jgi:hypothetical protein